MRCHSTHLQVAEGVAEGGSAAEAAQHHVGVVGHEHAGVALAFPEELAVGEPVHGHGLLQGCLAAVLLQHTERAHQQVAALDVAAGGEPVHAGQLDPA